MADIQAATGSAIEERDWWRGCVIYQIYPRSFQDSNNDGVGDLAGIIHRLPHIAELGADAVWISPFYTSPMKDFGYDVSDYRDVDPLFGTMGDFEALVARAHELGVKVIIDLVLSHTSDQHPWFKESRTNRDNPKADWYVWADPKPDGTPPNNWLSIFGGSAWEWDGQRMQYYMHNFLIEQPDLNFHCPEVQDRLLDVVRFWLEKGVDGFRLDTVNFYVHDAELRDNPALKPDERNDQTAPAVNPYNFQDHLYDKTRPENIAFLQRFRALLDAYGATTSVGEVGESQRGAQVQAEYTSGGDKLHMCYDFGLLSNTYPTGERVAQIVTTLREIGPESWPCWAYSNHDVPRHTSRWHLSDAAQRAYLALLLSIPGSACLYQGEELGLPEAYVSFEDLQDPYGKRFWPRFKGRDGCRTPIPWSIRGAHAGFSDAKPWLPIPVDHIALAADGQVGDAGSMLSFYRRALAWYRGRPELRLGDFELVSAGEDELAFIRSHGGTRLFCAFNLGEKGRALVLPQGSWQPDAGAPFGAGDGTTLPGWHAFFAVSG